jgi:predicted dehydrogenase
MLIDELNRTDDVQLFAIADDDERIRTEWRDRLGVPAYSDYRELFDTEDLDAVGIVSVPGDRGQVVVDALEAGLHVIADKPLCTTLSDLTRIEKAWNASGRILSMLLDKRFHPATIRARELIQEGALGEIAMVSASAPHKLVPVSRPDWMWKRSRYGGILNDLCIHDIDLVLWLCGVNSGAVMGQTNNLGHRHFPEFEDFGHVVLHASSGLIAAFDVHWLSPEGASYHGDYRLIITGTNGTMELRFAVNELWLATHAKRPASLALPEAGSIVGDFFNAVRAGAPQTVKAPDLFDATRLALIAQEHANTHMWIDWKRSRLDGSTTDHSPGCDQVRA